MVWGLDFDLLLSDKVGRFVSNKLNFLRASIRMYKLSLDLTGAVDSSGKNILLSNSTPRGIYPISYDLDTPQGVSNDLGNKTDNGKDIGSRQDAGK